MAQRLLDVLEYVRPSRHTRPSTWHDPRVSGELAEDLQERAPQTGEEYGEALRTHVEHYLPGEMVAVEDWEHLGETLLDEAYGPEAISDVAQAVYEPAREDLERAKTLTRECSAWYEFTYRAVNEETPDLEAFEHIGLVVAGMSDAPITDQDVEAAILQYDIEHADTGNGQK